MSDTVPFISVIVPTYNRATSLVRMLKSFSDQTYPVDSFEIIVCDNNSSDETKKVVESFTTESRVPVVYLFEERQGVHFARNSAAHRAKGDILYYTDDDVVADKDLLREIIKPFDEARVASVTGKVLPRWEVTPPEWVLRLCNNYLLSLNDLGDHTFVTDNDPGVFSCHQAIRKDIFFKTGGFNPENTAGEWIGDGETGINIKIKNMGYAFAYTGASVIHHCIPKERMNQTYLNKRMANQGNCDSYTEYKEYTYSAMRLGLRIACYKYQFLKNIIKFLVQYVLHRDMWRLSRAYLSYYYSRFKYDLRLIYDEEWRTLVLKADWLQE